MLLKWYVIFFFLVVIKNIQELVKGQKTKVFEGNPIPEYEVSRVCKMYLYVISQLTQVSLR